MNDAWKEFLDEITDPDTIKVGGLESKKTLNPIFWENQNHLNDDIANRLYKIAKNFFKNLGLDWSKVKDVTMTGSLANFNWSEYSDIYLHILVDLNDFSEDEEMLKDYFRGASSLWNKAHDIRIKGHEVEIYIQDYKEPHHSTGVYSIKDDKWDTRPSRYTAKIDYKNVQKKAAKLMDEIDEVYEMYAHKDYKRAHDEAERLKERIRNFRQAGLEKGGAYSVENLAFKVLRRNEYLQKLSSLKILAYDKLMSLNGGFGGETYKVVIKDVN